MLSIGIKIAVIVGLTHGLRTIGAAVGPRLSGLILGLPASTAVVLFFYGHDRGTEFAVAAANSALLGLVSAVGFALVAARLLRRGWSLPRAVAAATGGFLVISTLTSQLPAYGIETRVGFVLGFLTLVQVWLARAADDAKAVKADKRPLSWQRVIAIRTIVPVVCLLTVLGVGSRLDPLWAGLIGTFPCTLVAVLIVTYIESGARPTVLTAEAFPLGNYSMVSFVATFWASAPSCGWGGGLACGYLAAFLSLAVIQGVRRWAKWSCAAKPTRRRDPVVVRPQQPAGVLGAWPPAREPAGVR